MLILNNEISTFMSHKQHEYHIFTSIFIYFMLLYKIFQQETYLMRLFKKNADF